MADWFEVKFCFDDQDFPLPVKRRLLQFLKDHQVENLVESYYDGLTAGSVPEQVEDEIFGEADSLPLVVYCEGKRAAQNVEALVADNFPDEVSSSLRKLDPTESASAWTDDTVFTTGRFIVAPAGVEVANLSGKELICIGPGLAFGNGQHATTLAMLRSIEVLDLGQGTRILDVGTGCGVLLIAAAKLGARHLVGTDLSAEILKEAEKNLAGNDVAASLIETSVIPTGHGSFDLIMANIPVAGLRPLLPQMLKAAASGVTLILSGFTSADGDVFQTELASFGLKLRRRVEERGWVALSMVRID